MIGNGWPGSDSLSAIHHPLMYTTLNVETPNGRQARYDVRPAVNDGALVNGILGTDEYHLKGLDLSGWALDIGAHIGTVAVALALDNPKLSVIAVEPIPENADLIHVNILVNGLEGRVFVEEAGAGSLGQSTVPCMYAVTAADRYQDAMAQNAYIGNLFRGTNPVGTSIDAPVVTIAGLAAKYGTERFTFAKIDCEGCEWDFLADGAELIDTIMGEWHDAPAQRIEAFLARTHAVTIIEDRGGVGIFRAVRK